MKNLSIAGRIAFAIPMIAFGVFHFILSDSFASKLPVSNAYFLIYLTGLVLIVTGGAIALNKMVKPAALLLAMFLSLFAIVIHLNAMLNGHTDSFSDFFKDFGLAGAALYFSATGKD